MLSIAAVIVAVLLYLLLVLAANRARQQLSISVPTLKAQTARLDQYAAEYERLNNLPAAPSSATDLRTLAQAQINAAGLSKQLLRLDAANADQVQVVFGDVPFASWLGWVSSMQSQRVRLDICRIEAAATPGMVTVNATLVRSKPL